MTRNSDDDETTTIWESMYRNMHYRRPSMLQATIYLLLDARQSLYVNPTVWTIQIFKQIAVNVALTPNDVDNSSEMYDRDI